MKSLFQCFSELTTSGLHFFVMAFSCPFIVKEGSEHIPVKKFNYHIHLNVLALLFPFFLIEI